jgi:hypothetical protein
MAAAGKSFMITASVVEIMARRFLHDALERVEPDDAQGVFLRGHHERISFVKPL